MNSMLLALLLAASPSSTWLGPKPEVPVTRVVTLAPSLTQTVLALGAKDNLVGVSRFCDFPEVAELPKSGGFNDIAIETVVSLKPQLVVVQKAPANQPAVEALARLKIPVLALSLATVEDVLSAFDELGRVLGREARAQQLKQELSDARAAARKSQPKHKPRVLLLYGFSPLVAAGPGSFAHQLLEDCGAKNAAAKAPTGYPTYSAETLVALKPDVILDAAWVHEGREALEKMAPLAKTKWVTLPTTDLLHPGPALARALPQLCALVNDRPH